MSQPTDYALTVDELQRVLHLGTGATLSVIDRNWRFRYVNAGFARAFKLPAAEVVGRLLVDLYSAETVQFVRPLFARALLGETITYERMGRIHEDEKAWITVTIAPWRSEGGDVLGVVTTTMRVHELRIANEKLLAATQRLASHVENSPLAVLELDAALTVTRCSARAQSMLGVAPEQMLGRSLLAFLGEQPQNQQNCAPLLLALQRLLQGEDLRSEVQTPFIKPSGEPVYLTWFSSALAAHQSQDTQELSVLCLIEDVSAKRQAEQQLLHMVTHDPLTGLANRRGLAESLERMLSAHQGRLQSEQQVWCIYIDLDGFKAINDRYGHAAGDAVLIEVARRFRAALPSCDLVARVGGDEFVVLLGGAAASQRATDVCALLMSQLLAPCTFSVSGTVTAATLSASMGAASYPQHAADATELIKHADAAMYAAKHAGKNRVKVA